MPTFADFGQISTEQVPQPSGKLPTGFDKFAPTKPATRVSKGKIEQQGEHFKSFQTGVKKQTSVGEKAIKLGQQAKENFKAPFEVLAHDYSEYTTGFAGAVAGAITGALGKWAEQGQKSIRGNVDATTGVPPVPHVDLRTAISKFSNALTYNPKGEKAQQWAANTDLVYTEIGKLAHQHAPEVSRATGIPEDITETGLSLVMMIRAARMAGGAADLGRATKAKFDEFRDKQPEAAEEIWKQAKSKAPEIAAAWKAKAAERSAPTDVEYTEQVKAGKIVPTEKRLEDLTKLLPRGTGAKQGGAIDFSAFKGSRDDELGKELRGIGFTLPSLEAQPYGKEGVTKTQWKQALMNAPQLEKDIAQRVMEKHPDEYIPNKQLVKLLAEDTKDWKLRKTDTIDWAAYGLENIGRGAREVEQSGNAKTHLYTLPEHIKLPQSAHFNTEDKGLYGHVRILTEDGQTYVTELQADAIQNAKEQLSEHEKGQLEFAKKNNLEIKAQLHKFADEFVKEHNSNNNWGIQELKKRFPDLVDKGENDAHFLYSRTMSQLDARLAEIQNKLTAGQIPDAIKPFVKNWPQKLIQQELQEASSKGEKALRVITANTLAKVEGWPTISIDDAIFEWGGLKEALVHYIQKYEDSLNKAVKQTREGVQDGWEAADGGPNIANTPPDPAKAAQMKARIPEQMHTATNSMTKAWDAGQYFTRPKYSNIWDRYATDIAKYAKSIGGKEVTDKHGFTWWEVPVPKEHLARLVGSHSEQDIMAARARNSMRAAHDKLRGVGAKQTGALDIQAIKDAFDKLKKLQDIMLLVHRGISGTNKMSPSEGAGLYVTTDKAFADNFGSVKSFHIKQPKKPLLVDDSLLSEAMREKYPEYETPQMAEAEFLYEPVEKDDPVWVRINKLAAEKADNTVNYPGDKAPISDRVEARAEWDRVMGAEISRLARAEGYDAIQIKKPGEPYSWMVVIDDKLIPEETKKQIGFDPLRFQRGQLHIGEIWDAAKKAFDKLKKFAIPRAIIHDIGHSVKTMKDLVNPKAHGEQAKVAEAQICQEIAERMWLDQQLYTDGQVRSDFWDMQGDKASLQFIQDFEKGQPFKDPLWENARQGYKRFTDWLNAYDKKTGLDYDPIVDYMPHMWEDYPAVEQFLKQKYGKLWGDPNFTKTRGFQFAADALKAGFKAKFPNVETLMQMRAHASFVARSRANSLRMGEYYGYTKRIVKTARGQKALGTKAFKGGEDLTLRSPNGGMYYIDPVVYPTFINAFDTKSMWTEPGVGGMIFRAGSKIKNPMVAINLGWSLFHAGHITIGMIPDAALTRMTTLLAGKAISPQAWVKSLYNSMAYTGKGNIPLLGEVKEGVTGHRLLKVYKGELKPNSTDITAIQLMNEGGFVPTLDAKYKGGWQESFKKALMQNKAAKAIAVQPMAFMEWSSNWITEHMVPAIKTNQYLRDIQNWMKANPEEAMDPKQRMLAFTRIAKNIENRFGQMAYDLLLINRMIKDIGIFSSLSMGWKLGLFRGFIAGTLSEGPSMAYKILEAKPKSFGEAADMVAKRISMGELDRTIFTANYVAITMMYAGLITWLATGQPPQEPMDYVNPCTGRDPSGKCTSRVTTMFYTREAVSMTKHIENEGLAAGLSQYVASSAAPQIGEARTFLSGVDGLGREVSNPEDPFYKQMLERIAKIMGDVKPISIQAMGKEGSKLTAGKAAMDVMGFTPAAKYITESKIEGKIASTYRKSNAKAEQPYESVMKGEDKAKLRRLYESGDIEGFNKGIAAMKEKYKLNMEQTAALRKDSRTEGSVKMFTALTWKQQLNLLKQMSDEDKDKYLRHAHKEAKHALARGE